jgi:hypothetical protein
VPPAETELRTSGPKPVTATLMSPTCPVPHDPPRLRVWGGGGRRVTRRARGISWDGLKSILSQTALSISLHMMRFYFGISSRSCVVFSKVDLSGLCFF